MSQVEINANGGCMIEPLTVEVRDGETMQDALLRELRATTATLAAIHNRLIGDDVTPGGERLRRDVLEGMRYLDEQAALAHDILVDFLRRSRGDVAPLWEGELCGAARAELDRVVAFQRRPLALLPAHAEV